MTKISFIIILLLSFQIDWIEDAEKLVAKIDKEGIQIKNFEFKEDGGKAVITNFEIGDFEKVKIKYTYGRFMNMNSNFYLEKDFLFAQIRKGKDILIYKGEKKEDDPNSILIETRTFFKNENEGIRKSRKIKIYKNDDIEYLKKELEKKDFKTKVLNNEDYQNMKNNYLQI